MTNAALNTNGYTTADALDASQNVVFDPMYNDLVPKSVYDSRRAGGTASAPQVASSMPAGGQPTMTGGGPAQQQFQSQQQLDAAQQAQIGARSAVIPAQQAQLGARSAVIPYQQQQIDASRTANAAQGNVYNATANTFPIQQAVIGAKGQVIDAQGQQTAAQRGFIGQEQEANQAAIGDQNAIVQARGNTADQIAVAMYNEQQAGNAGIYASEGLGAPQRVITSDNRGGALAPGVIGDVQTQEQRTTQLANDRATQRALQLKGAQYVVDLAGTNVQAAEQAAARLGLTLDSANLLVQEAQNTANQAKLGASNAGLNVDQARLGVDRAGINVDQAQLGVSQAGIGVDQAKFNLNQVSQAPFAGAVPVIDPNTGVQAGWGTPAQADAAKIQYSNNQKLANAGNNALVNQQVQNAGQAAIGGGRPLGNLSQSQLLDLAVTSPANEQQVMAELMGPRFGLTAAQAYILISDAKPKTAAGSTPTKFVIAVDPDGTQHYSDGTTSAGTPPPSTTATGAQSSYNAALAALTTAQERQMVGMQ